ncbi:SdrD B-like domain-containing protein [Proteiniborus sp. MB09-C3]|nr:SdrD B-like domain-containing protein [Proteiniborus sp. MB09-C3]WIV12926.1 SdrD B-like domain-containing protein [Proteiniborus sp. MB09-C3]
MPTVSGRVVFDRDRSATINAGDSGLANVPIVLQNTATNVRLVVLTDANGNYSFENVPDGDYRIVESYGTAGGVPTPGDFSTAAVGLIPSGEDPPISFATNPPPGSTNLDSVTPDTLLVTVSGADLTDQDFLDGPVIYTPIEDILDSCATVSDINLIDAANNGTFGFFSQGTPANTGAPVEPYPGVTPDFTYVLPDPSDYTPSDGEYTVQNIMNDAFSNTIGAWWRIADHTTGNETGRMMVVNGFNPGAVFFRDTIPVQPNTNYLFSSWILNLFKVTGYPDPQLGVRILDENGSPIYSTTLGNQIPVNADAPEWKEIGTVINSQNNTNLTVEFLSEGPAAIGNDYAIDDISLREIQVPEFMPIKTVSTPVASVGQIVTYTVTLENTCTSPLTNVSFQDIVPNGLSFVPGTVTINGSQDLAADPNTGFTIPDIPGGSIATITFDAKVDSVPVPNPTLNAATMDYSYTPVEGGIENNYTVNSNTVPLEVLASADISVIKTANPNPVNAGEMLIYTINVSNAGPSDAQNVALTDTIPPEIINPEFSIDGGVTWNTWVGNYDVGTLPSGAFTTILIRGTVNPSATGTISNTANVTSTTPDPNPNNNTFTAITTIGAAELADISVVKSASPNPVMPRRTLVYTINVSNAGPSDAQNVVLTDAIPSKILRAQFSTDGGATWRPWTGSYNIGTLPSGASRTILIRGTVCASATGTISNTANVTSTTPDPNPSNNTSTVTTLVCNYLKKCFRCKNKNKGCKYYKNIVYNS